jgi:hypothetical protein
MAGTSGRGLNPGQKAMVEKHLRPIATNYFKSLHGKTPELQEYMRQIGESNPAALASIGALALQVWNGAIHQYVQTLSEDASTAVGRKQLELAKRRARESERMLRQTQNVNSFKTYFGDPRTHNYASGALRELSWSQFFAPRSQQPFWYTEQQRINDLSLHDRISLSEKYAWLARLYSETQNRPTETDAPPGWTGP